MGTGLAQTGSRYRRLYVADFRRAIFAWLITMAFETPVLKGMSEDVVYRTDHVRAAATFGHVELGYVRMLEDWQCSQHRTRTVRRGIYAVDLAVYRGIL